MLKKIAIVVLVVAILLLAAPFWDLASITRKRGRLNGGVVWCVVGVVLGLLFALALSDLLFLLLFPNNKVYFRRWIGFDVRSVSLISCRIFYSWLRTVKICSSWFIVLVTLERFVAVCLPHQAKRLSTHRSVSLSIVLTVFCAATFAVGWSMYSDKLMKGGVCVPNAVRNRLSGVLVVVGLTIYVLLPSALLLLLNPPTAIMLAVQQKKKRSTIKHANLTVMLLGLSVAYIVLALPIAIAQMIAFIKGLALFESTDLVVVIAREVVQLMELLNYSINFLLYVMCGRRFRQRVIALVCRCRRKNQVHVADSIVSAGNQ